MIATTLPVLLALSWVPNVNQPQHPQLQARSNKPVQTAQSDGQITCPITGEKISPCCCPVKK